MSGFSANDIESFPQLASSPDLNLIKSLWKTLKDCIRSHPHPPTSLAELKVAVCKAWDLITLENRVAAVLATCGSYHVLDNQYITSIYTLYIYIFVYVQKLHRIGYLFVLQSQT